MQGIDLDWVLHEKGPARAWNLLYALITDGRDEKAKSKLDSDIFKKPVGVNRAAGDARDMSLMAGAAAYAKTLPPAPPAIDS